MNSEILFSKQTTFTGRNGTFKCKGFQLFECGDYVVLEPVTSKGKIGHCALRIPTQDIKALIEVLKNFKSEDKSNAIVYPDLFNVNDRQGRRPI